MKQSIPNLLTFSRIIVIPALVAVFYIPGKWGYLLSAGLFLYAGVTDYLDGYLARFWQVTSGLGRFLDPIADKLLVATALMLLVGADRAPIIPSLAILGREILVSGLREFLAELRVQMPVTHLAKYKTAAQMLAIGLLLLGAGAPDYLPAEFLGKVLLWIAAGLTLFTGYVYLKEGLKHFKD